RVEASSTQLGPQLLVRSQRKQGIGPYAHVMGLGTKSGIAYGLVPDPAPRARDRNAASHGLGRGKAEALQDRRSDEEHGLAKASFQRRLVHPAQHVHARLRGESAHDRTREVTRGPYDPP